MDLAATDFTFQKSPWILNRWMDYLLVGGGLVWVFFVYDYAIASQAWQLLVLFPAFATILNFAFSNSHTAATWVRVFNGSDERSRHAKYGIPVILILVVVTYMGLSIKDAPGVLLKIYTLWVVQHYCLQVYGLSLLYCKKSDFSLTQSQRSSFKGFFYATTALVIIQQLTLSGWGRFNFLGIDLPFWKVFPESIMPFVYSFYGFVCILTGVAAYQAIANNEKKPPFIVGLMFATIILALFASGRASKISWFYIPALFHGSQYVAISLAYFINKDSKKSLQKVKRFVSWSTLIYMALVIFGGWFIYYAIPGTLVYFGHNGTAAVATIFAVFNFHHFITDAMIWRLREAKVTQPLLA